MGAILAMYLSPPPPRRDLDIRPPRDFHWAWSLRTGYSRDLVRAISSLQESVLGVLSGLSDIENR